MNERVSPTLLEFVIATLLLVAAWQIGTLLAPYVIAYLKRSERPSSPPESPDAAPKPLHLPEKPNHHGHKL